MKENSASGRTVKLKVFCIPECLVSFAILVDIQKGEKKTFDFQAPFVFANYFQLPANK